MLTLASPSDRPEVRVSLSAQARSRVPKGQAL
eukprot:CAMPEP_0185707644 /NCGR_PEP_ID=MMETSP1164-20130828/24815_1 /TAXON_ID=1104430 /ORGANISM="Chrysoreinhardia sp, Strain CCMP2950" /LENGTH=31 /DNA_ID= /DNA_START= /DNA_END= /DNA_ORIENTATION=